jgi:hypothetical protein
MEASRSKLSCAKLRRASRASRAKLRRGNIVGPT